MRDVIRVGLLLISGIVVQEADSWTAAASKPKTTVAGIDLSYLVSTCARYNAIEDDLKAVRRHFEAPEVPSKVGSEKPKRETKDNQSTVVRCEQLKTYVKGPKNAVDNDTNESPRRKINVIPFSIFRTRHAGAVRSLVYSSDGKTLASGSTDWTIKLWDVKTGKERATLKGHAESVRCLAYSHDGKTLASGSRDKTIKLWDVKTGKELTTLMGHGGALCSVAFSPDCKTLASASVEVLPPGVVSNNLDKTLKVWDVKTGKERVTVKGHTKEVVSVAFSPDGKTIASASGWTITLWNVKTGKVQATLNGHSRPVLSVAYSPDGKTIASGSSDMTIKLWDVKTGKERAALKGHTDNLVQVMFSPNGMTLLTLSRNGEIKLWDVHSGKEQAAFKDQTSAVVFSPDGKMLITGSRQGTIQLWEVQDGKEYTPLKKKQPADDD